MTLPPLPMTVIAGYLGAGKTTLINRLLAEDHGLRLLVMVNDFGAINIDRKLLASEDADTLTLTNGCVCCTMGADLFLAIGDALDRRPRPDHLVIEASGIADPARIANAARAEPDLTYGGIVTVVDGTSFADLSTDPMIGAQIRGQVACADLVAVSKYPEVPAELALRCATLTPAPAVAVNSIGTLADLLLGPRPTRSEARPIDHPAYTAWSWTGDVSLTREALSEHLARRPDGVFRLKGWVRAPQGGSWTVQVVGRSVEITPEPETPETALVAIGLRQNTTLNDIAAWWERVVQTGRLSQSSTS